MADTLLRRSVITSSSARELVDLLTEVGAIVGDDVAFDLMVLREPDVTAIESVYGPLLPEAIEIAGDPLFPRTFTQILAEDTNLPSISEWTQNQFVNRARVAALATYFPNVTSAYKYRRDRAIKALVNSVRLALTLAEANVADVAVVELVCGTILDPCECADCRQTGRTFVSTSDTKFNILLNSLEEVVRTIHELQERGEVPSRPFALGVELEPGDIYVLKDRTSLEQFFELLDARCLEDEEKPNPMELRAHVGLNLDIAHMRIAEVEMEHLEPFVDRIVHAHIADHPRMHTRDQVVGSWTSVDRHDNEFNPYLELLCRRQKSYEPGRGLPFTGAVALELEGCNRIGWIYDSLYAMKQLFFMAQR